MINNIFNFATKELTHDAFICWCINWYNDSSNSELKSLSIDMIRLFLEDIPLKERKCKNYNLIKSILEDEKNIEKVDIYRQFNRIDVLVIINDKIAIIVENKTFSSEHGNQIDRYKNKFKEKIKEINEEYEFDKFDIVTVFFKTGFYYDNDKLVVADKKIKADDIILILNKYRCKNEIINSYALYLEDLKRWYELFGDYKELNYVQNEKYTGKKSVDIDDSLCITKNTIAQYNFLRDIFPEVKWKDRSTEVYKIRHGTSKGRPWSQITVFEGIYITNEIDDKFQYKEYEYREGEYSDFLIFWRVDTVTNGAYISLRLYGEDIKKDEKIKRRHKAMYNQLIKIVKTIFNENITNLNFNGYTYEYDKDFYPGERGGHRESDLIHIKLSNEIKDGYMRLGGEEVINLVNNINDEFVSKLTEY